MTRECYASFRSSYTALTLVVGLVAVTKSGSHCPFLDGMLFPFVRDPFGGGWMLKSWADEAGIDFYKAALQVYGDRAKM